MSKPRALGFSEGRRPRGVLVTDHKGDVVMARVGDNLELEGGALSAAGDVTGPASSVDDRIATFDGVTGTVIQDSGQTIATVLATADAAAAARDAALDHGALAGLGDDDHSQYALLAARSGGQYLTGGTGNGDALNLRGTSHGTPIGGTGAGGEVAVNAKLSINRTANHEYIGLDVVKSLSTEGTQSTIRAAGYSPSIEVIDKDAAQNWFFGLDDDDSNALLIGKGYGPGQALQPAIKIDVANETVTLERTTTDKIQLTAKHALSAEATAANIRAWGYSPAIELLDKDSVQNWHFGLDDNDSNAAVIGRGYGPGQSILPSIKIDTSDVVHLPYGQLKFPSAQNASSDANTFDDYEEGTFTATIGGVGGQSGQVYSTQNGRYIKKGKEVTVWGRVAVSTLGTITGGFVVSGFPFAVVSAGLHMGGSLGYWAGTSSSFVQVSALAYPGTTYAELWGATAATTGLSQLAQANFANGSDLIYCCVYEATA